MFKGFKEFIMKGNVVDLAVAVVIGAAFNTVVERVVDSLITPIVGMVFNADSLDTALQVGLPGGGTLAIGAVIGALLNFLIVAAVVYFVFVVPMNRMRKFGPQADEAAAEATPDQELLTEIRDLLRAQVTAAAPAASALASGEASTGEASNHGAHGA